MRKENQNQMKYCDVMTLLNVTNVNVCRNKHEIKSCFANINGIIIPDNKSCGIKANVSISILDDAGNADL